MSLSAHEQHVLDAIEGELADSDPGLASRLTIFSRLTSGEALPAWEKIRPGGSLRRQLVWPLLWLTVSIAMIAFALTVGQRGAVSSCAGWVPSCATQAHAHQSRGFHIRLCRTTI